MFRTFCVSDRLRNQHPRFTCYQKAAEVGDPQAQFCLGVHYKLGDFAAIDFEAAFTWYYKAAEVGHRYAQYEPGCAYEFGKLGVVTNFNAAFT